MQPLRTLKLKLWVIVVPLLALANLSYFFHNFFGWVITLGVFLTIPGYLILQSLKPGILPKGEIISLSIGLSLATLIVGGLLLNSLHAIGLSHPLTTTNIFIFFDILSIALILLNGRVYKNITFQRKSISFIQGIVFTFCSLLPLLSIGGAIRLNNGASNILTLLLMASIGLLFMLLPRRSDLKALYPYAIFVIGISILFCNSIRGWDITGHDIHHEYTVFLATYNDSYWHSTRGSDPYNACLSITILPTIIARLTTIPIVYIYKTVFQIMFAALLPTLYYMFRKFTQERRAILGVFIFMTFPTFTNDLPFLNRQEVAFIFIILLLYVNFSSITYRAKMLLTFIFLGSIILSHYSSSYVTLLLLLISPPIYILLSKNKEKSDLITFPLLNVRVIVIALLLTFVWNSQITASTGNLRNTIKHTIINLVGPASQRQKFNYNLTQAATPQKPQKIFADYASQDPNAIQLVSPQQLPITKFGHLIGRVTGLHNAKLVNTLFHAFLAKVLQLLVIIGTVTFVIQKRRRIRPRDRYLVALACASMITLVLFTLLPQLAVDYDVTRLFQQSLLFLWLPSMFIAEQLFFFFGKYRLIGAAALFAFLYLNLAGFIPEITGGFPPQLPLNNSGIYYNYFYGHGSDIIGTSWLAMHRDTSKDIKFDTGAVIPTVPFKYGSGLVSAKNSGYLYRDYTDTNRQSYRIIIEGAFIEYTNPSATADSNKVYANSYAQIFLK